MVMDLMGIEPEAFGYYLRMLNISEFGCRTITANSCRLTVTFPPAKFQEHAEPIKGL